MNTGRQFMHCVWIVNTLRQRGRMILSDRHIYNLNDYLNAKPFYDDTYLVVKNFSGDNAEREARAFTDYMKSEFFRFMMLLAKNDQNLTRHCYRFVPDIPSEWYSDPCGYFEIEQQELEFIRKFIKKWDSEDTKGFCLNSN